MCFIGTFESEEITHVEGDVNPVRDIEIINEELRLKDEEYLMATIKKTESLMRSDKKVKTEYVIEKISCNQLLLLVLIVCFHIHQVPLRLQRDFILHVLI